jgi:23S rRNA pseudouridine1911/1915/1917 synthase
MPSISFTVSAEEARATIAAVLRSHLPDHSWSKVRQLTASRRVKIGNEVCLDPARRVREGDVVELLPEAAPKSRPPEAIKIRHLDQHIVVIEKPAGISTVRHPLERDWPARRKALSPTLEDLVPKLIATEEKSKRRDAGQRLRVVHRLDKETSGLVVFARTTRAQQGLGRQFHAHSVIRRYLAVIPGYVAPQRIASFLVRDRGDKRRGSTNIPGAGKEAITHIDVRERLHGYTVLTCRLETGRTHQIRIHLAELDHPVCGEKVYNRAPHQPAKPDESGAPRLALHASELGFEHPVTGVSLHWAMNLPLDLEAFLDRLRKNANKNHPRCLTLPSAKAISAHLDTRRKRPKRRTGNADQMD